MRRSDELQSDVTAPPDELAVVGRHGNAPEIEIELGQKLRRKSENDAMLYCGLDNGQVSCFGWGLGHKINL